MLRTFDQAGYYETRLILVALSLAIAGYFYYYKRDRRFLVMFFCGAVLQTIAEFALQFGGFRGWSYHLAIFGVTLPGLLSPIYQGLAEGGPLALFAFWFADLRSGRAPAKSWMPFAVLCTVVLLLSVVAGSFRTGGQITSQRPMFVPHSTLAATAIIFVSLWIAWRKNAISALVSFFMGLLLFAFLNYEPLHLLGVRYIGVESAGGFARASAFPQLVMMLLSHIFEASGGKLHYLLFPFAAGLVELKERDTSPPRERYSTQHLQDLAQRGWRKRSKPFTKP
ncbi:MAG: hypothetical protein ACREEM_53405 [Blastocatellia bacterium]